MIGLLFASAAHAHRPGLSTAHLADGDLTLIVADAEWPALEPALTAAPPVLAVDGSPCTLVAGTPTASADGMGVVFSTSCPPGTTWSYDAAFLPALAPGHRHALTVEGEAVAVLDAAHTEAGFDTDAPHTLADSAGVAVEYVHLGVEHILIGWDHLAFLLALLLVARSGPAMLRIVTGFTVAHSITLSLAALGLVTPPAWIVEAAIAASIAYAGFENLFAPSERRRIALTFGLGLIHGFGFAGVLGDLGLPKQDLLLALVAFNGGVELGQLGLCALALPVLLWMARVPAWHRRAVPALSLALAALGLWWTVERVLA